MRPDILFPLFFPVTMLPGIGPRIAKQIAKAAGGQVVDLCWHLPSSLIDRRLAPKIAEAPDGAVATITLTVDAHSPHTTAAFPTGCVVVMKQALWTWYSFMLVPIT